MKTEYEEGLREQIQRHAKVVRGGWKVGLTSGTNRDAMGTGFRPFGHIARERIFESGVEIKLRDVGDMGVENELCFHFGEAVPPNANDERLQECIDSLKPGFELNERRLATASSDRERLADNLSQYGIVVGAPIPFSRDIALEHLSVALYCNNEHVASIASTGHIDDHLDSLLALVRTLSHFELQIQAGDHVITGAYARARVSHPSVWRGEFTQDIGAVEVCFV